MRDIRFGHIVLVFACLAVFLNVERWVYQDKAPVKRTDVADMYITKFAQGAKFWQNPQDHAWDSSMFRGMPAYLGSVAPQHLCSLLSTVMPAYTAFTLYQTLIDFLVLLGPFLFFYCFLGYKQQTSLYASIFHLSMFYWFNENPYVTQAFLSFVFISATARGQRPISGYLRFFLLVVSILISYPPYTVPVAAIMHIMAILFLSKPEHKKMNVVFGLGFWGMYGLFYAPNLWGYMQFWGESNRSLWVMDAASPSWQKWWDGVRQMFVWFPAACAISLFPFYRVPIVRWGLVGIALIISINTQADFLYTVPGFSTTAFAWGRLVYYNAFVFLFLIAYLIEHHPVVINRKILVGMVLWLAAGILTLKSQWISRSVGIMFVVFGVWTILCIAFKAMRFAKNPGALFALAFFFLLPSKLYYVKHYEDVPYGYLFHDRFAYASDVTPFRVLTLSAECWHPTFYPAQALWRGQETLDGVSVFFHKQDAANWIKYIVQDTDPCNQKNWNNRLELVQATWQQRADAILSWARLNNTLFIRSSEPIEHPQIKLVEQQHIDFQPISKFFSPYLLQTPQHYLYKINHPVTRVFTLKPNAKMEPYQIKNGDLGQIHLEAYAPSRMRWKGSFGQDMVLASINFHPDWQIWIDGKKQDKGIEKGPWGMIRIKPQPGYHEYQLTFKYDMYYVLLACALIALALLGALIWQIQKFKPALEHQS